ncbi:hypothetical protein CLAFUW4_07975 [Fulvia fulva]|nr:hypothetical protein CLAFUR4_07980 [Fulvia fulva]WPV12465.1 hypothetical protein CLAFUW4_07975 [Fulvia fulva]WPV27220.1 hypothetical protein CLAFUW7_07976 [Fulvia fulva]
MSEEVTADQPGDSTPREATPVEATPVNTPSVGATFSRPTTNLFAPDELPKLLDSLLNAVSPGYVRKPPIDVLTRQVQRLDYRSKMKEFFHPGSTIEKAFFDDRRDAAPCGVTHYGRDNDCYVHRPGDLKIRSGLDLEDVDDIFQHYRESDDDDEPDLIVVEDVDPRWVEVLIDRYQVHPAYITEHLSIRCTSSHWATNG